MSTDLAGLQRMIKLPAEVKRCEWQTGDLSPHGGDWWLAAVLDVDAGMIPVFLQGIGTREVFETPPGLQLSSSFAALASLAGAQVNGSQRVRLITETYGVDRYASSPLLNGKAIRLSKNQVLVLLWTH